MKIEWIKFYGAYGDVGYAVGEGTVEELFIETYSSEPFCGRSLLRIKTMTGIEKVRSLDGANYDFAKPTA